MSDCKCNDEMVKLVEYSIVSIKPCAERIIFKGEEIYAEAMSPEAFAGWVIAQYLQRPEHKPISHEDKKFLRVYQRVLDEWPRPDDCCYDNKQLGVLEEINQSIRSLASGWHNVGPQPGHATS